MEVIAHATPPDALLENAVDAGSSQLFWVRSGAFEVRCEPPPDDDVLKLLVVSEGNMTIRQQGRTTTVTPGRFSWVHPDDTFELETAGGRQLHLRIPRDLIAQRHPGLDVRPAMLRGQEHGGERVLAELLQQVARERALSKTTGSAALSTLLEAIGMGPRHPTASVEHRRVTRALRDIDAHLSNPALQPHDVAARQGVSRRYLDGLFSNLIGETIAKSIRRRRLDRAAKDLRCAPDLLAAEIAARWGFRDASHFSRSFRRQFGVSPSRYRSTPRVGGLGRA